MAAGLLKPGFIERMEFLLIKLDNQRKFVTLMGNNGVTSCLFNGVVNNRMIFWCDLLAVDQFVTFIGKSVEMLKTDLGNEQLLDWKRFSNIHGWRNWTAASQE